MPEQCSLCITIHWKLCSLLPGLLYARKEILCFPGVCQYVRNHLWYNRLFWGVAFRLQTRNQDVLSFFHWGGGIVFHMLCEFKMYVSFLEASRVYKMFTKWRQLVCRMGWRWSFQLFSDSHVTFKTKKSSLAVMWKEYSAEISAWTQGQIETIPLSRRSLLQLVGAGSEAKRHCYWQYYQYLAFLTADPKCWIQESKLETFPTVVVTWRYQIGFS